MKPRRKKSGFSLLELVIALAVIAIAMFGILSMILHNMQTKDTARELQIAKEAVATKLEEIKSHPMQLPTAPGTDHIYAFYTNPANATFPVAGLTDSRLPTSDKTATGSVHIDATNPHLFEIMVTVRWVGRKGPSEISRRSMVAQ